MNKCSPAKRVSNRRPRKKALLIGINYDTLKGPQTNVTDMKALLMSKFPLRIYVEPVAESKLGTFMYSEENIVVLSDAPGTDKDLEPTYDNIVRIYAPVPLSVLMSPLDARAAVVHRGQQAR